MQKRLFFLVAMLLTLSLTAMAQITTSSMAGKVTLDNESGEEVIGATVVAVHEPSGTRYTAVTNTTGRFSINGIRRLSKALRSSWLRPTTSQSGSLRMPTNWPRSSSVVRLQSLLLRKQVLLPTLRARRLPICRRSAVALLMLPACHLMAVTA